MTANWPSLQVFSGTLDLVFVYINYVISLQVLVTLGSSLATELCSTAAIVLNTFTKLCSSAAIVPNKFTELCNSAGINIAEAKTLLLKFGSF